MIFSSPIFLFLFFPVTYLVYRGLPRGGRNAWLALASLVFYAFGQPEYVLLLLASVLVNYLFGAALMRARTGRRLLVGGAAALNLLALGGFKYLDFAAGTVNRLTGAGLPLPGIALPVGISFFTFQGLSYVIDVYRAPESGTRRFGKLLLYLCFFPQLIAGPIIQYHDVSDQIDRRELTPALTLSGLERFITGLAKKLLLADTAGAVADAVFAMTAAELDFRLAWLGAVCYTLQIYFDFSGYSDMAIGLGRMFGFRFRENFELPYVSRSIKEFWRRWHISLSAWFRDYLYIPLGGNRKGRFRTGCNKFLVFFATGLWHGASWTFVLWGLWHGLFAVLEDVGAVPARLRRSALGHVYAMLVIVPGFVLFRADTLGQAGLLLGQMFTGFSVTPLHTLALRGLLDPYTVCVLVCALLLAAGLPQRALRRFDRSGAPAPVRDGVHAALSIGLFLASMVTLAGAAFDPFIYFRF